ncbi:MAG: hypothetical protein CL920_16220 [Deltaproteobacteria bacterium]|nr:hypothetical protein [Deltaproteobacteria bacterium]MBU50234.1 hypothetical protein [Deltaproteobacteria bacterium]|tara:strand:- start:4590 stop:4811 length:222 start_codon:yes stop_codon:yes gene_type:complete
MYSKKSCLPTYLFVLENATNITMPTKKNPTHLQFFEMKDGFDRSTKRTEIVLCQRVNTDCIEQSITGWKLSLN